jgi:hypothetical protein
MIPISLENVRNPIRDLASALATMPRIRQIDRLQEPRIFRSDNFSSPYRLSSSSVDEGFRVQIAEMLAYTSQRGALDNTVSLKALKKRTPILHKSSTFHPLKAWKNLGNLFLESDAVRETYSATVIQQKIQQLEELLSITPPGTKVSQRVPHSPCKLV